MCSSREGSFLPSVYARGYAMINAVTIATLCFSTVGQIQ